MSLRVWPSVRRCRPSRSNSAMIPEPRTLLFLDRIGRGPGIGDEETLPLNTVDLVFQELDVKGREILGHVGGAREGTVQDRLVGAVHGVDPAQAEFGGVEAVSGAEGRDRESLVHRARLPIHDEGEGPHAFCLARSGLRPALEVAVLGHDEEPARGRDGGASEARTGTRELVRAAEDLAGRCRCLFGSRRGRLDPHRLECVLEERGRIGIADVGHDGPRIGVRDPPMPARPGRAQGQAPGVQDEVVSERLPTRLEPRAVFVAEVGDEVALQVVTIRGLCGVWCDRD